MSAKLQARVPGKLAPPTRPREDRSDAASVAASAQAGPTVLELILELEGQIRDAKTTDELKYFSANNLRRITGARQTFVVILERDQKPRVKAVSSVAAVEPESPLVRWIESLSSNFIAAEGAGVAKAFRLPAYADEQLSETGQYPFRNVLWQPLLLADGSPFAAILQTCERPFSETDQKATFRLAGTIAHAWRALAGEGRLRPAQPWRRWIMPASVVAVILAGAIRVPLTTIAPMHVVPAKPFVIAAPLDGVIDKIEASSNSYVKVGDPLVRFDSTSLRNRVALAERELGVATESYNKYQQQAFFEDSARYQLAISRAERELKQAELAYARDLLAKTRITAPVAGLAIYGDRQELEGHPVSTGQTIMKIADPQKVEVEIELPVSDAIVLKDGAKVRVFLDRDPLNSVEAKITSGSYEAQPQPNGQLIYKLRASFVDGDKAPPRIGARGTAQVFGDTTSLAFFLLRRPLSVLRQQLGV